MEPLTPALPGVALREALLDCSLPRLGLPGAEVGTGPGGPGRKLPVVSSVVTNSLQSLEEEVTGVTPKPEADNLPGLPPSSLWLKRKGSEASEGGGDTEGKSPGP